MKRPAAALLLIGLVLATANGQRADAPVEANPGAPGLLFVRLSGPKGLTAGFFEGDQVSRQLPLPSKVGLRPGYVYRLRHDNLPGRPGDSLYPSIEVRNALRLPPTMRPGDYPAPITFSEEDIERAVNGTFITKVIRLETPDTALDVTPPQGASPELDVLPDQDPVTYAKRLGRPMIVVRLGAREPEPVELARLGTGLILFPGERVLPPASVPPHRFDPRPMVLVCGPNGETYLVPGPPEEECLRDGGDLGVPVHFGPDGKLQGVNPSDSVASYTDVKGNRRVAVTNIVCVCVPRFLVVRHLLPPHGIASLAGSDSILSGESQARLQARRSNERVKQIESPETMRLRQGLYANVTMQKALRLISLETLGTTRIAVGAAEYSAKEAAFEATFTCPPDAHEKCPQPGPLRIHKSASADHVQIGDEVTFYLRYENCSNAALRDVAISDSLSGRFQYVPGSARTDREALFVTQDNEAGSLILRWEIRDPLPPGGRGAVSFKAKVR